MLRRQCGTKRFISRLVPLAPDAQGSLSAFVAPLLPESVIGNEGEETMLHH
jgi:hypothetical protein